MIDKRILKGLDCYVRQTSVQHGDRYTHRYVRIGYCRTTGAARRWIEGVTHTPDVLSYDCNSFVVSNLTN